MYPTTLDSVHTRVYSFKSMLKCTTFSLGVIQHHFQGCMAFVSLIDMATSVVWEFVQGVSAGSQLIWTREITSAPDPDVPTISIQHLPLQPATFFLSLLSLSVSLSHSILHPGMCVDVFIHENQHSKCIWTDRRPALSSGDGVFP